jgi:hypothetical protein
MLIRVSRTRFRQRHGRLQDTAAFLQGPQRFLRSDSRVSNTLVGSFLLYRCLQVVLRQRDFLPVRASTRVYTQSKSLSQLGLRLMTISLC